MQNYRKHLTALLMVLSVVTGWAQQVIYSQSFDQLSQKGGNDGQWKSVSSKALVSPWEGCDVTYVYPANQCVRLGKSGEAGVMVLPALAQLMDGCELSFHAGAWDAPSESAKLLVEAGQTRQEIELKRGQFTPYKFILHGVDAATRISLTGVGKNSRFFLDELLITRPSSAPVPTPTPTPTPKVVEVSGLAALRALPSGTDVVLKLPKEDMAYVHHTQGKHEAYVADAKSAVMFEHFLLHDRGWHPRENGAIVGCVAGRYELKGGMPTFVQTSASRGNTMLCLDQVKNYEPKPVQLRDLLDATYRANYVVLNGVEAKEENGHYMLVSGHEQLMLSNHFSDFENEFAPSPRGRRFVVAGVLGAKDGASVLYPTYIVEQSDFLRLDEQQNHDTELAIYDEKSVEIELHRVLTAGTWNPLCLPFDVDDFEEATGVPAEVVEFTDYDVSTGTVRFSKVERLQAGKPYLVKPAARVDELTIVTTLHKKAQTVRHGAVAFVGTLVPQRFTPNDESVLFVGAANQLIYPSNDAPLQAFRAYFQLKGGEIRKLAINGEEVDITAIEALHVDNAAAAGVLYNLAGQRIQPKGSLQKGVYLHGREKILVP